MMLNGHSFVARDSLAGLGDTSTEPPSRLTWFVVGAAVMLFARPLMGIGEGILGLGHAGIGRARKRIER